MDGRSRSQPGEEQIESRALRPENVEAGSPASGVTMPPCRHPLAVPALVLAIVAFGGTLLALIFGYLQTTPTYFLAPWEKVLANVLGVMYLSAPLLGITSLIMAYVASGGIKRSSGQLTGSGIVAAAKWIAWLGPFLWIITLMRLLVGPMSAQGV